MTELPFELVAEYGVAVLFVSTFLSCLALPVPASMMMLAGGAFVATGDLAAPSAAAAAYAGALVGDQTGFGLGRAGGAALARRLRARPRRARLMARAHRVTERHGALGVFISRWLLSPLGPYVNVAAGGAGLGWARFTLWDAAGEAVWVGLYLGLGAAFASHLEQVAAVLGNVVGLAVAITVAALLAVALRRLGRAPGRLLSNRRAPRLATQQEGEAWQSTRPKSRR